MFRQVRFEESRKKLKIDIEGTADFTNDRFSRRPTHLNNYWSTAATVAATAAAMEEKEKPVEKKEEGESGPLPPDAPVRMAGSLVS
jgi:hypothetical protein